MYLPFCNYENMFIINKYNQQYKIMKNTSRPMSSVTVHMWYYVSLINSTTLCKMFYLYYLHL